MSERLHGDFLIAADQLRDQNFYRAVVLILEHNDEGAMGLVVNRPSSLAVDTTFGGKSLLSLDTPIFIGGPVENSALFVLHNFLRPGLQDREVVPGLFLAGSNDSLEAVVNSEGDADQRGRFRVFCGYAGWGSAQLDAEIARGDWLSVPADSGTILEEDPYQIWEVCTRRFRRAHRILPHNVRNPEWN